MAGGDGGVAATDAGAGATGAGRPMAWLPWRQLITLSVYWFGIQAIWGGYEAFGQKQVQLLVGEGIKGTTIGILEMTGALIAILVQPTAGTLSDYTATRWGKRKAYIIVGATFDLIFLAGLALVALPEPAAGTWDGEALGTTPMIIAYVVCFLGLQLSSNAAQGPFQGYVPDLVPERQVGTASGLMGVMRLTGLMTGTVIMAAGSALNLWGAALVLIGLIELTLAVITFLYVREGPVARPRGGRSWRSIAGEAWGTDVLRERSFLFMSTVRLCFLAGTGIFVNVLLYYLEDAMGMTDPEERGMWQIAGAGLVLAGSLVAAPVSAAISNRTGRKPVILGAIVIAGVGIAGLAAAPTIWLAIPGIVLLGAGGGAYLAVDWALMTEVIPLAASGRYMGLGNIANSMAGPVGLLLGGLVLDAFTRGGDPGLGVRAAVALGILFLMGAAIALPGVRPRRDPRMAAEPRPA
ncbi:MAG: MFS transporter [Chloroflexi bacterium]|jgi:MFS family permease|nr:MFS transporter [Chloroflexota bacterium]